MAIDATVTDGSDGVSVSVTGGAPRNTFHATATASGDGTTQSFSLGHNHPSTPNVAFVEPTSEDASTDHWKTGMDSATVTIKFAQAPASGTDNLQFDLITR